MTPTDKLELQVQEDADGSAVVQLPEGEGPQNQHDDDDDHDEGHNDGGNSSGDIDPEREAIRAARREERHLKKKLTRAKTQESNHLINALKRQNEQMAERLAVLEKRTAGSDLARLDKAIEDAQVKLQWSKMKIKEATEMADGAALADANEAWYEARRQVEAFEALKRKAVAEPQSQNIPQSVDPILKRNASDWMARNDWYDPNGNDMDSEIATRVDKSLVAEGWDPKSPEYWDELDNRLTKYLPHRYNVSNDNRSSSSGRPRSVITSTGREAMATTRGNEFRLSPDRVRAIKEAGRWDNIEERNRMIRKYAEYDRMNGGR
jgi:hypothetical protein